MKRVMLVFGTRPEAIKMAPLILALQASPMFEPLVVVTAQHRGMLDQVLNLFDIVAAHDLDLMRPAQTLPGLTALVLERLPPVLVAEAPDAVIVQGDTTTTFATSLAGFYQRVPVMHLEAGLRTGDPWSPYPEEMNRRLTTHLATLHLAPTPSARSNLLAEGIDPGSVVVTGNTGIDALLLALKRTVPAGDPALADLVGDSEDDRPMLLVTAHRRESWAEGLAAIGRALAALARAEPELVIVLPIHLNPVVRQAILPAVRDLPQVRVVEPLAYGEFCRLMKRARVVLSDSGGIQEEAPCLGKPVLVMRDKTERPEAVEAGVARLVGTDERVIVEEVRRLLHDQGHYAAMAEAVNPYGDGRAAGRTVAAMAHQFGLGPPAEEFVPVARSVSLGHHPP